MNPERAYAAMAHPTYSGPPESAAVADEPGHRVIVTAFWYNGGQQYRNECTCGHAETNVAPNAATLRAHQHARAASDRDRAKGDD